MREEREFGREEEEEGAAFAGGAAGGAADAVDVVCWVVGRIVLHDPVYGRDLCCISTEVEQREGRRGRENK